MKAYPSLVDRGETVSLRLADSPERAALQTRGGLRRLFYLVARHKLETHAQWLPDYEKLLLWSATLTYPPQNDSVGNASTHYDAVPESLSEPERGDGQECPSYGRCRSGIPARQRLPGS